MGIDKIKIGPRSRFLEKQEKDEQEAMLDAMTPAHPPLPGPANPMSLRSCGCGHVHIPRDEPLQTPDGVIHRYSAPCYSEGPDGEREYYNVKKRISLEDRVTALEKIVTELLAERQDMVDADAEASAAEVRADLAYDAAREDRIFGRHR